MRRGHRQSVHSFENRAAGRRSRSIRRQLSPPRDLLSLRPGGRVRRGLLSTADTRAFGRSMCRSAGNRVSVDGSLHLAETRACDRGRRLVRHRRRHRLLHVDGHRTRDAALVAHTAGMSLSPIRSLPQRQWCCSPQPGQHWQIWQGYRCLAAGSASASSCISSPGHVGFLLSGFNFGCGTSRGRRRVRMSLFPVPTIVCFAYGCYWGFLHSQRSSRSSG